MYQPEMGPPPEGQTCANCGAEHAVCGVNVQSSIIGYNTSGPYALFWFCARCAGSVGDAMGSVVRAIAPRGRAEGDNHYDYE